MPKKAKGQSLAFLQKFQGKKAAVSKQGLIHMLQNKLESVAPTPNSVQTRKPISQKAELQLPASKKRQLAPIASHNSSIIDRETPKAPQSQRYSLRRYQTSSQQLPVRKNQPIDLESQKSQQLPGSKLKLPSIHKTQSQSLHSGNMLTPRFNKQGSRSRIKSLTKTPTQIQSMVLKSFDKLVQLDSYALEHLECLDKFERLLINQKLDIATRSTPSEPK